MVEYDKDLYFVAVKLLIRDGKKLLIMYDIFGAWDLPGGRIKKDEFEASLPSVWREPKAFDWTHDKKWLVYEHINEIRSLQVQN